MNISTTGRTREVLKVKGQRMRSKQDRSTAEDNMVQMTNNDTQTLRTKRASLSITGTKGCTTTMTQVDKEYITGVMSVQGVGVEV